MTMSEEEIFSIDLVEAAIAQRKFLKLVDEHPCLMLAHMFKMLSEGMTESNVIVKLGTNGRTISSSSYLIYTVT